MIVIPVLDANDSLTEVELDGITYFLRLSCNSEAELWALSIENVYNELSRVPSHGLKDGSRTHAVPEVADGQDISGQDEEDIYSELPIPKKR